jgi:hypothetical protein
MEETDALDYIAEKVKAMERHEFREWFKLDGVAIYPAHSPGGELL